MRSVAIALLLAVGASSLGCGEKTTGGAADTGGTGPRITKFRFGSAVSSNGIVITEMDSLPPGSPVYMSFEAKNLPAKSKVKTVWSDSSKKKISEEQVEPASAGAVSFQMKDASTLAAGDYIVEIFYGDAEPPPGKWTFLGSKTFRVGLKSP